MKILETFGFSRDRVLIGSFSGTSFCEQIRTYAKAHLIISFHGATVLGNAMYLGDTTTFFELRETNSKLAKDFYPLWLAKTYRGLR